MEEYSAEGESEPSKEIEPGEENNNKFAKIGMILSIVAGVLFLGFAFFNTVGSFNKLTFFGFQMCCIVSIGCLGGFPWIGAVILGILGFVKAKELGGKKSAIIALVVAAISFIILAIGFLLGTIINVFGW